MSDEHQPAKQPIQAAEPLLKGPKRQHFVNRAYLEGFCNKDGKLAVYDRELDEVRVQQPLNTAVIGHFYTFVDNEGRKRFELEAMLCDAEGKAKSGITKLAAKQQLTNDEREDLAIYVSLACFRTPDMVDSLKLMHSGLIADITRRTFSNVDQVKEILRGKDGVPTSEEELEQEARAMVEFAQSDNYEVTTNHQWAVGMAMQVATSVAQLHAGRNWLVVHRPCNSKSFVTSDAPVILSSIRPREPSFWGIGFGSADAAIGFPLTQSCALIMFGNQGALRHREIDSAAIRQFNLDVAARCQRFVIGRDEQLIRHLKDRLRLADKKWQPKMQRVL